MIPPLAGLEALADRLGFDPASPDSARARAALEDASALIRSVADEDWLDDHGDLEEVPAVVVSICLAVAFRAFRNPDATTQSSVGDVSVTYSREGAAGSVFLSSAERKAVRKAAGKVGFGSVGLTSGYLGTNEDVAYYVDVEGGGDKFPIGPFPWEAW